MKKQYIFSFFFSILSLYGVYYFVNSQSKPFPTIPSAAGEENKSMRSAWEKMRLADPATGKIPDGITFLEQQFASAIPKAAQNRDANGTWQSRGPWNVGGRTRALAMDITNPDHLFAGGVSGGIWESTDRGQSWIRRTPLNAHPGVVSITQDTRTGKTNNWYYLSGEITGTSASGGSAFFLGDGMFKSTDNGQTWTPIGSTDNGSPNSFTDVWQSGWRLVSDPLAPSNQNIIYAATYGTIWRSTNGGTSWTAVRGANVNPASYYTDIAISTTGVLYATMSSEGGQKGIWRSTNGTTWTNITPATGFPATYNRFVIGINPNNENEVYFLGNTPESGHYNNYIDSDDWSSLWKYTYIGGNGSGSEGAWSDLSGNLPATGTEFDQFAAQGGYDLVVKVQPGTNNVFVGGTNLWRSTDGFSSPSNTTHIGGYKPGTYLPFFEIYPNHHPDVHDVMFHPTQANVMLTASDGGLHRTEDCTAANVVWTPLNRGYQTTQFYTAIIEKSTADDPTIIGGLQDNGNFFVNSTDPVSLWKQTVNGDGSFGAIPDGKPYYILSIQQGRVAKCAIDPQGNVTAFRRIDPIGPNKNDYMFINPLALDPTDQNILYLPAGRKLYRQNNLAGIGLTNEWDSIPQGWTLFPDTLEAFNDQNAAHKFSAMAVSNNTHRLYLGTTRGKLFRIDNANAGSPSMTALTLPNTVNTTYISCLAVDPDNADRVIAIYSNYAVYSIFLSENGGDTWKKTGGNLETNISGGGASPSVRWMSILPLPDGKRKYFCGTSTGLFSTDTLIEHTTTTQGTQWVMESPDLIGSSVVDYIDSRRSDGLVVAATHGIGLFSANFTTTSAVNQQKEEVQVRIYPNPVSEILRVQYEGDDAQFVLYNNTGNRVKDVRLGAGGGNIVVNNLPKGIYYYEIIGKKWKKTGKVVVSG